MAESNRILASFTTDSIRPLVVIDGVEYEVAQREDFGLKDYVRVQALKSQLYDRMIVTEDGSMSDEDVADAERMLNEFVRLVLRKCPETVLDKLSDLQKLSIAELFNSGLSRTMPQAAAPNRAAKRSSTSTSSSRRSSGSTAARRTTG